jgi:transcription elongation factor Elf1
MKTQIKFNQKKMFVECLLCSENIDVSDNPKISKFITCKNCESIFEIITLDPVMIDWPYYDDEGFDDDFDDDYDY